jgi:peptidoglycan pentaglycine glycine transferase (the first glycine)
MATASLSRSPEIAQSIRVRAVETPEEWEHATSALNASILQSWNWGEFKARHGWGSLRLLCECEGEPVVAAQILSRKLGPFAVLYIPRGPAFGDADDGALSAMTMAIDRVARHQRAVIAFLEPDRTPSVSLPETGALGWLQGQTNVQPLRTIKVPVNRSDDDILAAMKNKTRYNVRLAGRRGVNIRRGTMADIAPFYELLEETSDRDGFGIHTVEYYADMIDVFGERAALLLAEFEGEIAAGAIVLQHGDEAIYMFGASARKHQRHMPTHLVQFEAMRWARERGCQTYDLWGIPATDTPPEEAMDSDLNVRSGLWGVYRFKQGFGGEVVSYPGVYERHYYPRLVALWRRLRPGLGA